MQEENQSRKLWFRHFNPLVTALRLALYSMRENPICLASG